jgi:hypothetical protein
MFKHLDYQWNSLLVVLCSIYMAIARFASLWEEDSLIDASRGKGSDFLFQLAGPLEPLGKPRIRDEKAVVIGKRMRTL